MLPADTYNGVSPVSSPSHSSGDSVRDLRSGGYQQRDGRYHRRPRGGSTPPSQHVPHCRSRPRRFLTALTARAVEPGQGLLEVPVPSSAAPSPSGGGGAGIQCVGPIVSMSCCSHFLTSSDLAAPDQGGDCCNALESFVPSTRQPGGDHLLECLCLFILRDVNKNLAKPVSLIRLMQLSVACGVTLPKSILTVCSGMDSTDTLPLQEMVPLGRTAWKFANIVVLSLLIAALLHRSALILSRGASPPWYWVAALACEAWFTLLWLLNMNVKWSPVRFETHPERLAERVGELPAVDMFVTTADPNLEPPVVTVNTVLSLLAVDHPADKLACYVSDDGCSPVTFHALREATEFAKLWVPFCKRHHVQVRAPFVYFSSSVPERGATDDDLLREWTSLKNEYEKLVSRIENAEEGSLLRHGGEYAEFLSAERRNHPTIIKVLWDNSTSKSEEGFPSLIYVSREKRPKYDHHFKAGAMNVLTRVSAVLTNAPIMLNVDCDMFANNPKVVLHAMCLLLGFDDEVHSGFVQSPHKFYGGLKDDPFGNQLEVLFQKLGFGIDGVQGIFYGGTGCFHRRKAIYGTPPDTIRHRNIRGSPSCKELRKTLGSSKELIESARSIISGDTLTLKTADIPSRMEAAKEVSTCSYETGTCWGQEVGWVYGSITEDVLTGQRIHAAGWRSAILDPNPPAFMGGAPTGGPATLTQYKRWATGFSEILVSKNNPILLSIFKHLDFRQCLAYLVWYVWTIRSVFELCYALLGPYCLIANRSFLPKMSEPGSSILLALFLTYHVYNFLEYMDCRLSARAWWNNQRMQRITSASAWLLALLTVLLKTLGLSETVFEVTRKDKSTAPSTDDADPGRFTFDSSPLFIPPTALTIVNIAAIAVGAWRAVVGAEEGVSGGPGIAEFACCGWLLLMFWPFVRGLVGKGSYGIPWSVKLKAGLIVGAFIQFCRRI